MQQDKTGGAYIVKEQGKQQGIGNRQFWLGLGTMVLLALVMVIGLTPRPQESEEPQAENIAQVDAADTRLAAACQVVQRMTYAACGHEVTRRQPLPQELVGKGRAEAETAYDTWQITAISANELSMEQQFDFCCPEHQMLMPDASGVLCVFENRYGDALALVRSLETPLSALPESVQEEVRQGKVFDTAEELERWMESIES